MKIYGEYFDVAMRKRMSRERIPSVRRAVVNCSRYALRGYIAPIDEGSVHFYHLRRDGRVQLFGWGPTDKSRILEVGEELTP